MYSPTLGTFLSRDPLSADGIDLLYDDSIFGMTLNGMRNLYEYCEGNPVNRVDPSGLKCENVLPPDAG